MIPICEALQLKVYRETKHGFFLGDEDGDEILLPSINAPEGLHVDDMVEVFTYFDSQNRLISTTQRPHIGLYEFALLRCVDVAPFGAFMAWGLDRDLLIPNGEQEKQIQPGEYHICYLFLDHEDRPTGTTKITRILERNDIELQEKEEVELLVWERTTLGYKVIIDNLHEGLIYHNEIYKNVFIGKPLKGFVKKIREDKKIDISLERIGYKAVLEHTDQILEAIKDHDGRLPLHDKSDPEEIKEMLHMSKKVFKKAVGALYKDKKIVIKDDGLYLP
jgi:uncharacterized protein